MSNRCAWREVETVVHRPALWLPAIVGLFFMLAAVGFLSVGVPEPRVLWWSFLGVLLVAGIAILLWVVRCIRLPVRVHNAADDVLPEVPREPLICEGMVVHGRLSHELREDSSGWELRPSESVRCSDRRFLLCFGIPFFFIFSALLAWSFQGELHDGKWPIVVLFAVLATAFCGGTVLLIIGLVMRAGYRRLSRLTIPRHDGEIELETTDTPDWSKTDMLAGLKWLAIGEKGPKRRLTIPRDRVAAVQLCPWKYVVAGGSGKNITWAVQGLLVLTSSEPDAAPQRLPLLLTGDFVGAARLIEELAGILRVPYLFSADTAGWREEEIRAKTRPPLHAGGFQS